MIFLGLLLYDYIHYCFILYYKLVLISLCILYSLYFYFILVEHFEIQLLFYYYNFDFMFFNCIFISHKYGFSSHNVTLYLYILTFSHNLDFVLILNYFWQIYISQYDYFSQLWISYFSFYLTITFFSITTITFYLKTETGFHMMCCGK